MDYADKLPPSPWYIFAPPPRYIFPPPLTELIVTLDGAASANSYPWRALAAHLGWTPE